jgi:hypothetical protein
MTLSSRDRRALAILGAAGFLWLGIYGITSGSSSGPKIAAPADNIDLSEKRLARLRSTLAAIPGKQETLKQASAELLGREKGLIGGDTGAQAQAQLLQILRRVAKAQTPALEIRQVELGQVQPFGDAYGEVTVSVTVDCRIEDLVNFMAGISEQPEEISTGEVRFGASNPKQKTMPVRLTVSGIVPRKLVPVKKGMAA